MLNVEQGDLLRITGTPYPVIIVSNNYFNASGKVIVCPIVKNAPLGPLHISLNMEQIEGFILCEQMKYIDLSSKRFTKIGSVPYYDIPNISDAVMGIFDYQVF
jgi:mRNA-degrading endonuclease toxin of MazEF toxin-antitoxin module